ncbi:MAG: hypothetical protein A2836_00515 [Candidatus Taylorbacteria bacterium RIFCSPHIGHO2_01_FULL_45_63]|uniref:DUF7282 domain-containing protein n=1 Tax=Candidatus Taylorbacteria bacterium RIFCSPHIGHO2_02_FULL_45_35 TaxID=1802311 RepID=A0A1G2MRW6_9BACT|nr:MAG: hypothetical protein A2836_00515 [Candidatus Taylorbacteria bacterium RIFCSPHIGHO2_01_FULL_45_63]OHA25741.1 MAG: hypothetical protein A3D56_03245 [Candidatus Taylorbacteria bacterium RIFCSPHIGHO2_02_FULL_45_35]OHA34819.1 MAG: hypothetical protein A3A22_00305 [Candidatus Taylorbacteria bacterium RIFCSPLOWO2_01_FULL_45_34b]
MENQNKSAVSTYIITAVIAFAVGFGSAWIYANRGEGVATNTTKNESGKGSTTTPTGANGTRLSGNAIVVSDQAPGVKVQVSDVTLEKAGWVVIHEDDAGKPGKILGAQLFDAGANQIGVVELLRGTEDGGIYYAMIHSDNDNRSFDPKTDMSILDVSGNPVMVKFMAREAVTSPVNPTL